MQNQFEDAIAGQAVYSKVVLSIYDLWVLGISNSFIWKCSSKKILEHFKAHISNNHLDIGVGTGYFLDKCNLPNKTRIGLMDMNPNSLNAASSRIKKFHPEKYQQNVLEQVKESIQPFDSISVNFLFHCLPGSIEEKAVVFDNILPLLKKDGVIFGSTILQGDVKRSKAARKLMAIYNKKGIFSNEKDTLEGLETSLKKRFSLYGIRVEGCVALFWARK